VEQERLQVLRLVESGRVTPDQAVELLRALGPTIDAVQDVAVLRPGPGTVRDGGYLLASESAADKTPTDGDGPRWLRVRVTDRQGHSTADVQLPLSIVRIGLSIGGRWLPQLRMLDPGWVMQSLRERAGRPVFTFKDSADGDRVVIWVE